MSFWNTFFLLLIYIPLIMIWAFAVIDIFRRDDIHGGAKAAWLIVVLLLPFIGTLIYLIARKPGSTPEERAALEAARGGGAAAAPPSTSTADQLHKLADLHDRGKLSDEEFASEKARLLATTPA
jgi:type VI protein secretion system component VasK